ncbi:MAG TPA: DUF2182 domain-containing protein [Chloroflexota bacterium]|nr:DUF2182 domain-containing protein [Chloroflexota bacterium]
MPGSHGATAAFLFSGMWLTMMAAMMLPAISPVLLLFRTVSRKRSQSKAGLSMSLFATGYLGVWSMAGVVAYFAYLAVQDNSGRVNGARTALPYIAGGIVILAGIYQFTPLKDACLKHCRTPLDFILHHWRDGRLGALSMGASHGLFCLGCCWGIMAVLFVIGLMNLEVMALLSILIIVEKLAARGRAIGRATGVLFMGVGLLMAVPPHVISSDGLRYGSIASMSPMKGTGSMPARGTTHMKGCHHHMRGTVRRVCPAPAMKH